MRLTASRLAWLSAVFAVYPANSLLAQNLNCPSSAKAESQPWLNKKYSPECRAKFVVDSFASVDEKIDAIQGDGPGEDSWVAKRGLPMLGGTDGPAGIRLRVGGASVTALPAPISVAATFDRKAAYQYGDTIGSEFFDFGLNRVTGPGLDIARTWRFGRGVESFGEDPYLTAEIVVPEIEGIHANHVMTTSKHFTAYNQEQGRGGDHPLRDKPGVNVAVSERALREIYLPGFEAAVRRAKTDRIMCSFPRINGVYSCENPHTLGILRNDWGFDGTVGPDFPTAQRSIIAAVNAGLDTGTMASQPPPPPGFRAGNGLSIRTNNVYNGESIKKGYAEGKISLARIDDLLMRRLVPGFRVGAFDNPAKRVAEDVSTPARQAAVTELAIQGTVLLKNDNKILPFNQDIKSVAIVGHQAGPEAAVTLLGSGFVAPAHLKAVLPAVEQRAAGRVAVSYAQGTLGLKGLPSVPTSMVKTPAGEAGFTAEYFANPNLNFSGASFLKRQEPGVSLTENPNDRRFPADHQWSVRWTGMFMPFQSGVQHFTVRGSGTAKLFIGGKLQGFFRNVDFGDIIYANVDMKAGTAVEVRVEYTPRTTWQSEGIEHGGTVLGTTVQLGWSAPNKLIDEAVDAARKADVAVVFVGDKVGEGMDRESLALPNDQNALIEAVAAVNPRTVVVLQTGGAVSMPWLSRVPAVLQMWYPGDGFGPAAAGLLFGDQEPGGRLPVTFPVDEKQGPGQTEAQFPGTLDATGYLDTVHYDEGIAVGYRFWDMRSQTPLFPFGHGLSYSSFEVKGRGVSKSSDGGAVVTVDVRNTGSRKGSEVVQIYVGMPAAAAAPPRQLKGFEKVELAPGQSRTVKIKLEPAAFSHWSETSNKWTTLAGQYQVMVGTSSRNILSTHNVTMAAR